MTVAELITALQAMPQNRRVFLEPFEGAGPREPNPQEKNLMTAIDGASVAAASGSEGVAPVYQFEPTVIL